ncbi:hypothetical protein AFLA_002065 [Aspergillus flavus NRRL3357]|nr:hypothetical protein AFLA_002065 [Aspergillus flavus NRRL3357]
MRGHTKRWRHNERRRIYLSAFSSHRPSFWVRRADGAIPLTCLLETFPRCVVIPLTPPSIGPLEEEAWNICYN